MRFVETPLPGVLVVEPERVSDERGYFARTFSASEFGERGLQEAFAQSSVSFNARRATLRGMHYQAEPHGEVKLIRCTRGAAFDVALDLRRDSPAFKKWFAVELTANNGRQYYLPRGVAHGFLTLTDETELHYEISEPYRQELQRGVRWNDEAFAIDWPMRPAILSARDRDFPDFA